MGIFSHFRPRPVLSVVVPAHARIPLHWDDARKTLTVGDRLGRFPGMPESLTLAIVVVGPNHGAGEAGEANPDGVLHYSGLSLKWTRNPQ